MSEQLWKTKTSWPLVYNEAITLGRLLSGASIARFGDGEFKIMQGRNCVSQKFDEKLQELLITLVAASDDDIGGRNRERLLTGIPTMDPQGPKFAASWERYIPGWQKFLWPKKEYFSAFISRPDSAPWIACKHYFDSFELLWRDKPVILVRGGGAGLEFILKERAASVETINVPSRDAFASIDAAQKMVEVAAQLSGAKTVFLSAGPMATVLALKLYIAGYQAIDIGHIGKFWRHYELYQAG